MFGGIRTRGISGSRCHDPPCSPLPLHPGGVATSTKFEVRPLLRYPLIPVVTQFGVTLDSTIVQCLDAVDF